MKTGEKKFVPVMITPFAVDGKVDAEALTALIEFYLNAGAKGLFANCLSSEMFSISEDERINTTKFIVEQVRGRVPVVATASFGMTLEDKATFTKKIFYTGIDAAVMITGHFAKIDEGDDVLMKNFKKMFQLTGSIPLGTYECPAPYKRILSPHVFKEIISSGRMIYHKDTSITIESIRAKLDVLESLNDKTFEFYDAHTPNAMLSLRLGAKGMSSIAGNFYPEILVWMCNNANNPEKEQEVKWLQSELTRVDPLLHEAYPMSAKYFLQKRGLPVRPISRTVVMHLTPGQKKALDQIYQDFSGWCDQLGIKKAI